jgi:hypothetical protein
MAHYFGRQPETMIKLTPSEHDALVESTRKTVDAAEKANKGRR